MLVRTPAVAFAVALAVVSRAAVIEVTEGGDFNDATYMFSDSSGTEMSSLKGNSTAVTSSTDLVTGSGNSVNDLAARLAAAEAIIALLPIFPRMAFAEPRGTSGGTTFFHQKQFSAACESIDGRVSSLTFAECSSLAAGSYTGWAAAREWHSGVSLATWAPGCVRHNLNDYENGESLSAGTSLDATGGGDIRWNTNAGASGSWWTTAPFMSPVCKYS